MRLRRLKAASTIFLVVAGLMAVVLLKDLALGKEEAKAAADKNKLILNARSRVKVSAIMGVETNSMQFYPAASAPEEAVHPGLYRRRNGQVDLSTLSGAGFGYRLNEINRNLPEITASFEK